VACDKVVATKWSRQCGPRQCGRVPPDTFKILFLNCFTKFNLILHFLAFVPIAHCTTGWKKSRNSKLSFPSGHAAISVFSTLFLFFYLRGLQRRTSDFIIKLLFVIVSSVFISFTTYCCISRVTDFWHYPTDVLGGVCIGSLLFHLLLHKYYETRPHSI